MRLRWKMGLVIGAGAVAWAAGRRLGAFGLAVTGSSMAPSLEPGQFLVAVKPRRIRRGDVVVVRVPGRPEMVKRVVGLPGERLEVNDGRVQVGDRLLREPYARGRGPAGSWDLPEDGYFVLGDDRDRSTDSRAYGPVKRDHIVGAVLFRYWPRAGLVG